MKSLIIYYSLGGNTKFIANQIKLETGSDILELKPVKDLLPKGLSKYIWGGKQVVMNEKPELMPYNINLDEYEHIFIGSPVWVASFAPAIKTFLSENKIVNKKIIMFCCSGGGIGNFFNKFKKEFVGNDIISQVEFIEPLKANKEEVINKVKEFLNSLNMNLK